MTMHANTRSARTAGDPQLPLAVTMGDPAGVGLELTARAWQQRRSAGLSTFVVYGAADALHDRARDIGLKLDVVKIAKPQDASAVFEHALPVIDMALAATTKPGVADPANGAAVISAIERAVAEVRVRRREDVRPVVTFGGEPAARRGQHGRSGDAPAAPHRPGCGRGQRGALPPPAPQSLPPQLVTAPPQT